MTSIPFAPLCETSFVSGSEMELEVSVEHEFISVVRNIIEQKVLRCEDWVMVRRGLSIAKKIRYLENDTIVNYRK